MFCDSGCNNNNTVSDNGKAEQESEKNKNGRVGFALPEE